MPGQGISPTFTLLELQSGLQMCTWKKCLMIWYAFMYYLRGTEVAQKNVFSLYFLSHVKQNK